MKTGLFGGAFNPVHSGHLHLASKYLESLKMDRILFIPTSVPPHKSSDFLACKKDRLNMLSLAIKNNPAFEMTDIEFKRSGKSYSYNTILELKRLYPNDEFYFIIGSDQFFAFKTWYRADDILNMITVCTAARESNEYQRMIHFRAENENMKSILISNFDVLDISSSQIRNLIKKGRSIKGLVPDKVEEYIRKTGIYV